MEKEAKDLWIQVQKKDGTWRNVTASEYNRLVWNKEIRKAIKVAFDDVEGVFNVYGKAEPSPFRKKDGKTQAPFDLFHLQTATGKPDMFSDDVQSCLENYVIERALGRGVANPKVDKEAQKYLRD